MYSVGGVDVTTIIIIIAYVVAIVILSAINITLAITQSGLLEKRQFK